MQMISDAAGSSATTAPPPSPPSPDDWRSYQSATRQRLRGPFASVQDILDLVLPTLNALGLASGQLQQKTRRFLGGDLDRANYLNISWLQDVQQALLGPIALDWSHELRKDGVWEALLFAFFAPSVPKRQQVVSLISDVDAKDGDGESEVEAAAARVTSSGLQVVASACSRFAAEESSDIRTAITTIVRAYAHTSPSLISRLLVSATRIETNAARSRLEWQDGIKLLVSLPDRLASFFRGDVPADLNAGAFYSEVVFTGFFEALASASASPQQREYLTLLFVKLLRTGHLAGVAPDQRHASFWARAVINVSSDAAVANWAQVFSFLTPYDQSHVALTLIAFLDCAPAFSHGLVAREEYGKPALCGKRYLSAETSRTVAATKHMLDVFLTARGRRHSTPLADEDDDDGDDENDVLTSSILSREHTWTTSMGRAMALHARDAMDPVQLRDLLSTIVDHWGDAKRIRTTSIQQEHYLVTSILALLAETQRSSQGADSTLKPAADIGAHLTTRPTFIHGVASHLEHLDPQVRRLGMLLAEVVSEVAHNEATSVGDSTVKKLQFGASMWDGSGQGREECRVLRTMYYSWSTLVKHAEEAPKRDGLLSALALSPPVQTPAVPSLEGLSLAPAPVARTAPTTRSLPAKKPPPPRGGRGPLIMEVGEDIGNDAPRVSADVESDGEASSSDSDSSADSDGETDPSADLGAGGMPPPMSQEPDVFELNTRKRRRPPVYIWEITSMLREQDRDANRVALKEAAILIRRKAGWGAEVDEQAIDLAMVLVGLQNNYAIKSFESRRTTALTALVMASPRLVVGAIVEQFFSDNTSIAQRFAVLTAIAEGARELAGLPSLGTQGDLLKASDSATRQRLTRMADSIAHEAIARAKAQGEQNVPEIKAEQSLKVTSQRGVRSGKSLITEVGRTNADSPLVPTLPGAVTRPKERYVNISSSVFIFPLLNRLRAHISEASSRLSRLSSFGTATHHAGIGTSSLFDPTILGATLDTLSVMIYSARNSLDFTAVIAPEVLEMALVVITTALPLCLTGSGAAAAAPNPSRDDSSVSSAILGASASLALVALDTSYTLDRGRTLLRDHNVLLNDTVEWASAAFQHHDEKRQNGGGGGGGTARPTAATLSSSARVERCTAAIILRVEEMRSSWREDRLGAATNLIG